MQMGKEKEKIVKERDARYQLIQRASAGDEEARKKLAGPPYNMRVYTPEEREAFEAEKKL